MRIAAVIALALGAVHAALAADPSDRAATGFFRVADVDGRPGIVAPDGTPRFVLGCCWVHPRGSFSHALGHSPYGRFCETNYPSQEAWAEETLGRLRSWGFNNLGAASDVELCGRQGLSHVATLRLGQDFAKGDPDRSILPYGNAPGTALPNVFHPDWPAFCETRAEELCAAVRDDPWLLGWFLDNELAWGARRSQPATGLCEAVAALPTSHSARQALEAFLANPSHAEPQSMQSLGEADSQTLGVSACSATPRDVSVLPLATKLAFLRHYARTYFETACAAVRRHDPNHLILGCRFAGLESAHPVVWEEAGRFCDVVSVNVYPWADLDRGVILDEKCGVPVAERFREYGGHAGKPLFVSEWSFPALDTGRKCLVGAGQRVPTQEDRAEAAALFLRTMRDDPHVVGCDWFMWCDRPAAGSSKWNPEDCNYGLVNEEGVPYEGLVRAFAAVSSGSSGGSGSSGNTAKGCVSERERFFAEAREAGSVPGASAPGAVGFRQEADGAWSLSNAFVRLSGRVGSRYMADEIAFSGGTDGSPAVAGGAGGSPAITPVGRYGACVHLLADDAHIWLDAERVTDVSVSTNADIVSVTIRAEGGELRREATRRPQSGHIGGEAALNRDGEGGTPAFAVTHRLTLAPGSRDVLAEIVSLENLGSEPLFVKQLFLRPYSLEEKPVAVPFAPNVLHGPCEAAWRLPGGGSWGVSSRDEAAARFRFFVDRAGVQHPDARFAPDARAAGFALDPGAVWRPSVPHSALLHTNP